MPDTKARELFRLTSIAECMPGLFYFPFQISWGVLELRGLGSRREEGNTAYLAAPHIAHTVQDL